MDSGPTEYGLSGIFEMPPAHAANDAPSREHRKLVPVATVVKKIFGLVSLDVEGRSLQVVGPHVPTHGASGVGVSP